MQLISNRPAGARVCTVSLSVDVFALPLPEMSLKVRSVTLLGSSQDAIKGVPGRLLTRAVMIRTHTVNTINSSGFTLFIVSTDCEIL